MGWMDGAPARCLDLTRLVSRLGRGAWTGVDRVELAYLRHLAGEEVPLYLLVRTSLGFVLVAPDRTADVLARLEGHADWGTPDLIGHLSRRAHPLKRRAVADLRRFAVARCLRGGLARMLARQVPAGTVYFNVGHSDLSEEVLAAWKALPGGRIVAMVHDTIPLDYPEYQRAGMVEAFLGKLRRLSVRADLIVCSTDVVRNDIARWMAPMGRVPPAVVAHLGVEVPEPGSLPPELEFDRPYFVTVGTIEPRKDHALLLDVWESLGEDAPFLVIAGRRGWRNEQLFQRLETSSVVNRTVFERGDLDDETLAALLLRSAGLLFPSFSEGFGLPVLEATALNVPVLTRKLPVYTEVLGDIPVYVESGDVYSWKSSIIRLAVGIQAGQRRIAEAPRVPTWQEHFNRVLNAV